MIKNSMRRIRSRMKLRNLKTSQRMALAYGLVMALVLATAWVGVSQLQMLNARLDTVVNVNNQRAALSSTMIRSIYGTAVAIRSVALSTSKEAIAPEAQRIKNGLDQYLKAKEALQTSFTEYPVSEEEQLQFVKADGSGRSARALMEKMLEGEVDREEVTILIQNSLSRTQGLWIGELEKLVQVQSVRADATALEARAAASRAVRLLIGFGVLAAVLCLISGWLLTRSVTSGIRLAVERSQRIATGNLTPMASVERGDDFEALLQALELMRASIGTIVTSVNDTSQGITAASSEIAGGSQDLSNRTEEAAAMLQETAESAQRLTAAVRQSADSTREASDIASQTAVVAKRGGDAVGQVVSTMVAIQDSSRRIVDIIAVIDGIAFQTNILALNAAVEAARAGEQGRGFAVVASEVRALAQRSATAAKEIKGLIAASVDKVESGSRLVKDAGDTMTDIVVRVQRVTTIIGEVAGELAQQASSVGRLHDSVGDLDQITQQNAALAEQSAAAAMGLKDQARTLSETVSRFEV